MNLMLAGQVHIARSETSLTALCTIRVTNPSARTDRPVTCWNCTWVSAAQNRPACTGTRCYCTGSPGCLVDVSSDRYLGV